jgi:hypothetical protein
LGFRVEGLWRMGFATIPLRCLCSEARAARPGSMRETTAAAARLRGITSVSERRQSPLRIPRSQHGPKLPCTRITGVCAPRSVLAPLGPCRSSSTIDRPILPTALRSRLRKVSFLPDNPSPPRQCRNVADPPKTTPQARKPLPLFLALSRRARSRQPYRVPVPQTDPEDETSRSRHRAWTPWASRPKQLGPLLVQVCCTCCAEGTLPARSLRPPFRPTFVNF